MTVVFTVVSPIKSHLYPSSKSRYSKMELMLGRDLTSHSNVYLDASGTRAILVCGKRGSGKSYSLGVLLEELITVGGRNVIPIVIDPMGIFHTMVLRNEKQSSE